MTDARSQDEILVETRHLKKYFSTPKGPLHAVDDINLQIKKRSTLGVVGESGCGKSTLGRTMIRLIPATSGEVLFHGEDILQYDARKMKQMRKHIQIIFQDPYASLNPRMSIRQIIAEPLIVCGICHGREEIDRRVRELMDTVGLAQRLINTYPHELDGGRRQRIGIARALAVDPEFIVCDEPVSALDVSIQAQILNLLMDLRDEKGLTYMFITHDLGVVRHLSDEIMVMYLGQCVEKAPAKQLFEMPSHPYTQALLNAIPLPSIRPEDKMKHVIKGELSSPVNPKPGCRFASRCPYAKPECTAAEIPLCEIGKDHVVACIKYQ